MGWTLALKWFPYRDQLTATQTAQYLVIPRVQPTCQIGLQEVTFQSTKDPLTIVT